MTDDGKLNKTVLHVFKILDMIAATDSPIGVSELAHQTTLPKTTVFRLLNTLEQIGAINKDTYQQYRIGSKIIAYGKAAEHQNTLVNVALPYMQDFTKETKENINLGVLYDNQVLYLHAEQGEKFSLQVNLLPVAPLYCSSSGKIFLSDFTSTQLDDYLKHVELRQRTINTITNLTELKAAVTQAAETKLAYDNEEYEYGLSCMAVPLYHNGKIIAAASVSGPTSRLKVRGWDNIRQSIIDFGQTVNQLL